MGLGKLEPSRKDAIEILCKELLKKKPNQKLVKSLMKEQGIPFTKDPLLQLSSVLELLDHDIIEDGPQEERASDEAGVF